MTCGKLKHDKGSWTSATVQAWGGFMQDLYQIWTRQMGNQMRDNSITISAQNQQNKELTWLAMLTKNWAAAPFFLPVRSVGGYPIPSDSSEGPTTSEGRRAEVGVTWAQSKSHHFVNTADTLRERSHTHKSMQHVRPTGISKPELWILCLVYRSPTPLSSARLGAVQQPGAWALK